MSQLKRLIAPVLLLVVSLLSVWESIIHFTDGVVEEYDGMLIVWILNQTIQKIPNSVINIFQSNIFFPFENSLAFSVLMIPSAFLSLIPVKLTNSFVSASNFTIIFGQVVSALVIYYWLKDISGSKLSSFIGAVALILSKIRFNYLVHLQMWTMYWWLIPSWLLWRYFKHKELKYLYAGFIFMGITIWENVLSLYFIAVILGSLILFDFSTFRKNFKHFLIGGAVTLLISLPVVLIYRDVSVTHGFVRTIRDAAHFSAGFDELGDVYFAPSIFLLFGIALFKFGKDKAVINKQTKWLSLVFSMSLIFIFGPVVKWGGETVKISGKIPIPLPYLFFYYIIPGLNALRTTSRWIMLTSFSVVAFFAYAFRGLKLRKNKLFAILLMGIALIGTKNIKNIYAIPSSENIPGVYQWLEYTNYNSILELPMYTWTDKVLKKNEYYRLYYSLFHQKLMVNGVSGFMPKVTEKLLAESRNTDSIDQIIDALSFFDPDVLIIHEDQYDQLLKKKLSFGSFAENIVWKDDNTYVIELKQP